MANTNDDDLTTHELARLGDELDAAEAFAVGLAFADGFAEVGVNLFHLRGNYFGKARDPWFAAIKKLEDRRKATTRDEVHRAFTAWEAVRAHLDMLFALGPDFYNAREICDAQAVDEGTEQLFLVSHDKCPECSHLWRDARRDGTVTRKLVINGVVKTGRYKKIDGVRIPIVERVR
jgi:hypothetical protein